MAEKKPYKQLRADSVHSQCDADVEEASVHSKGPGGLSPLDQEADGPEDE